MQVGDSSSERPTPSAAFRKPKGGLSLPRSWTAARIVREVLAACQPSDDSHAEPEKGKLPPVTDV
jgi:hypothetical protein